MNPHLPDEAAELARAAQRAFAALGDVDAARRAEVDPSRRSGDVVAALEAVGLRELEAQHDDDSLVAAAALCEAAGRVVLPYPVPAAVLRDEDDRPLALAARGSWRVDHGDLFATWRVATVDGRSWAASRSSGRLATRLGPFVADLEPGQQLDPVTGRDIASHLTLTASQVLGTCSRAVELAVEHVTGRVQFGKPLSAFQAVQFQLADAAVAVAGLRELATFTLWRLTTSGDDALPDALALRVHALDVACSVLRTCQQLHGAAGVCDEYDVSVLCRHVQPPLRLPFGAEQGAVELATAIERSGFDGLFPHGAPDPAAVPA